MAFSFSGDLVAYDCPLCGRAAFRGGRGQSLVGLAHVCMREGRAISECHNCGKRFQIPSAIFAPGVLDEFRAIAEKPGDALYSYVTSKYVKTHTQHEILRRDWYRILLQSSSSGPLDTMAMELKPGQDCPHCGRRPRQSAMAFTYACPHCRTENTVREEMIDGERGVRVACRQCMQVILVPASVWCPKCHRGLVGYYSLLRLIAHANCVELERLEPGP